MLAFYADDAGKKDNNAYVIAAEYVGLVAQWESSVRTGAFS
jgi:hypothetical protein